MGGVGDVCGDTTLAFGDQLGVVVVGCRRAGRAGRRSAAPACTARPGRQPELVEAVRLRRRRQHHHHRLQQFVYDTLGRLKEMATDGTPTESYEYDRYGNQTKRTTSAGPQ